MVSKSKLTKNANTRISMIGYLVKGRRDFYSTHRPSNAQIKIRIRGVKEMEKHLLFAYDRGLR